MTGCARAALARILKSGALPRRRPTMYRPRSVASFLAVAAASVMTGAPGARADQARGEESATNKLQEVVVTAQKYQEKLHDVPMSISAVTAEELDKQHLVNLEDLQNIVPGLSLEEVRPGETRLTLRGQNVGGTGAVTTYIDDTPFGSSNALVNGFGFTGDFDAWDLQRVEILRGPQGTLYGAGSEGGLLKYVTNPPDPTKFAAAAQVGGEDVAHGEGAGAGKGMINLPIGDRAAFRLSGYYSTLAGYIDDPSLGEKDVNHGYRSGVRAALLFNLTDDVSVRLNVFGQDLHTDSSPYVDVVGAAGTPLTPPANQLEPTHGDYDQQRFIEEPSTFKYRIYSGTLNWNLDFGTLSSITSYGTTHESALSDVSSNPLVPGLPAAGTFADVATTLVPLVPTPVPAGVTSLGVAETDAIELRKFTQEVRLASSPAQTLEWQVGVFYTRESSTLAQTLPTFYIPRQVYTPLASLENDYLDALYREWAAFAQLTYHFTSTFDLAFGGRWSENKQSVHESISGLVLDSPPLPATKTSGDSTDSDFTYSIAPRWYVGSNTMVYGRIATGYRPGAPNALPPVVPPGVQTEYKADRTTNYELGIRTDLLDNRLSVDVAAFLVDWTKIQLFEFIENFGINANGGRARSKGLEWTLGLTPLTGLTFTLTGALVDAYLTSAAPDVGANDGDRLPYAPRWSGSLDGDYTWLAFSDYNAFVGATWSFVGSRFSDFSASPGATGFEPTPRPELPSYGTVNLRAGLENAGWTFEIWYRNVGDVRGIAYYTNSGTPHFGGAIGYVEPRTIGAAITARF
jgi:iron complex outermembrane recepter protein